MTSGQLLAGGGGVWGGWQSDFEGHIAAQINGAIVLDDRTSFGKYSVNWIGHTACQGI